MTDLVLQSPVLREPTVEAFALAFRSRSVSRGPDPALAPSRARLYDVQAAPADVQALARALSCDAELVPGDWSSDQVRLLAMDMDSTLITIECIDEIARLAGLGGQVAAITEAAMRGEIADFSESLRRRVALLRDQDAGLLDRVLAERLQLSPGAEGLIAFARARGWRTLLVSGGFTFFTQALQRRLGIDDVQANELEIVNGRLTGVALGARQDEGRIVDAAGKARALVAACARAGCTPDQAIAIGDGANDLQMMEAAGCSVAWRAKPRVRERARHRVDFCGLDSIANYFRDPW